MFAVGFILGLCLCLPASICNELLAMQMDCNSAVSWPLLSGLAIIVMVVALMSRSRSRGVNEGWGGGLLGVIIGSGVILFLHLFGW